MANPEHLAKLNKGVPAWNAWRDENVNSQIDLTKANLSGANLSGANLSGANLSSANLSGVSLVDADLTNADLTGVDLSGADVSNANFSGADLAEANLTHANLQGPHLNGTCLIGADLSYSNLGDANLQHAMVVEANFYSTDLTEADFTDAMFGDTSLSEVDLSSAKGLDDVRHSGPCSMGIDTIYKSKGKIPESFLLGCGVPRVFIDYIPSMIGALQPIERYSVFISHSSKDQVFAERLHADLQSKKVRCWFAPEDLKIGEKFRVRIDEIIRVYDKLLLVLSENSVGSEWVEGEVETAMEKERQQKRTMLFPIRLDDAVNKVETGWPAHVRRARHIGDFTQWKDHDSYTKAFGRLMRDLKADEKKSI